MRRDVCFARPGMGVPFHKGLRLFAAICVLVSATEQKAAADGPQGHGTPGTTITITPSGNLGTSRQVALNGVGFRANWAADFQLCGHQFDQNLYNCVNVGQALTDGSGSFGPVSITVNATFQPAAAPAIDCRLTTCIVHVVTED